MKYLMFVLIAVVLNNDPMRVSKINSVKAEAKKAFNDGDYAQAVKKYKFLLDSMKVDEEEIRMNLASAYFLQKDTANAMTYYQSLTNSTRKDLATKANQQMGVIANQKGRFPEALNYFKQAIKAEPRNDDARYNYELVKKKLDEQKKKEEQQQKQNEKQEQKKDQQNEKNKDQQKQEQQKQDQQKNEQQKNDQKNQDQKNQQKNDQQKKNEEQKEDENKEDKESEEQKKNNENKKDENRPDQDKLQDMKMSEEKARMILEAMRDQEKQYLQQKKRKATKSKEKTKPDW